MNFELTGRRRGTEAFTLLRALDLVLHDGKNHNPVTQFLPRNSKSLTGRETFPREEITSNSWQHKTIDQSKGNAFGEQGREGEPNPALRSHLCVSLRLRRREGDDTREEDARVLHYRADTSAMEFGSIGLARPFGARSPLLDLNTKMMTYFPKENEMIIYPLLSLSTNRKCT
jgi:hypothetical protein